MKEAGLSDGVIKALLDTLDTKACQVCGLGGHGSAQCWFHQSMYDAARNLEMPGVNIKYRAGLRYNKAKAKLLEKQKAALEKRQAETNIKVKLQSALSAIK